LLEWRSRKTSGGPAEVLKLYRLLQKKKGEAWIFTEAAGCCLSRPDPKTH